MISRIVLSLAAVAASVGLLLYGMGSSYQPRNEGMENGGLALMAGGVIALVIGIFWYRKTEESEVAAVEAEIRRRRNS